MRGKGLPRDCSSRLRVNRLAIIFGDNRQDQPFAPNLSRALPEANSSPGSQADAEHPTLLVSPIVGRSLIEGTGLTVKRLIGCGNRYAELITYPNRLLEEAPALQGILEFLGLETKLAKSQAHGAIRCLDNPVVATG